MYCIDVCLKHNTISVTIVPRIDSDDLLVRFSLNGNVLKSRLCDNDNAPSKMVRLAVLGSKLKEMGSPIV
jgi:hypothetical protein